ncbi:MAG: hypothetical protein EOP38_04640 [Rubrivivax sp.]|nr:MAG: hypothetical protein EOP38_04640 [Rubrivivax sp.]
MPFVKLDQFEKLVAAADPKKSMFKSGPAHHPDIAVLLKLIKGCPPRPDGTNYVSLEALAAFQSVIWQVGSKDDPWQSTKQKYADAFMYLVEQLFLDGPSVGPGLVRQDALLLGEYKSGWMQMILSHESWFWHRSRVELDDLIASRGITPRYATEVCIPSDGLVGDWPYGCKFVFTVKAGFGDDDEPLINKGGKLKDFGFGKYAFLIRQPAATRYMSDRVVPNTREAGSAQVAFPDPIPLNRITVYQGSKKVEPHPWVVTAD